MKRLIDEEDAIRAICKNCYAEDGGDYKDCRYYPCDDVQAIEALPSTDLERIKAIMKKANEKDREEQMGRQTDLISRAEAIGIVEAAISDEHISARASLYMARAELSALPSADITETETCQKCQETTERILNNQGERIKALEASAEAVHKPDYSYEADMVKRLRQAEADPKVIRSRTLMPTKDFKEWAKRVREDNPNVIVIPCDAEVASAEAVQVVRCKDCRFFSNDKYEECRYYIAHGVRRKPNDFCSYGKRKGGEDK